MRLDQACEKTNIFKERILSLGSTSGEDEHRLSGGDFEKDKYDGFSESTQAYSSQVFIFTASQANTFTA
jgi:hypothetical protein